MRQPHKFPKCLKRNIQFLLKQNLCQKALFNLNERTAVKYFSLMKIRQRNLKAFL